MRCGMFCTPLRAITRAWASELPGLAGWALGWGGRLGNRGGVLVYRLCQAPLLVKLLAVSWNVACLLASC